MTGAEIKADSEKTTLAQLGYTGGDAKLEVKTVSYTHLDVYKRQRHQQGKQGCACQVPASKRCG